MCLLAIINEEEYKYRQSIIKSLIKEKSSFYLNSVVVQFATPLLYKCGKSFEVIHYKFPKKRAPLGKCFITSYNMTLYQSMLYVEGSVTNKVTGEKIAHAWNIDKDGIHVDFTFNNPSDYEYFGIVIPFEIVFEVNRKRGMTYCILPFLKG